MELADKLRGFNFKDGIYIVDTRSFRIEKTSLPEKLYILDSEPLTYTRLIKFLSIVGENNYHLTSGVDISEGWWPLKYIYIIWNGLDKYYVLNRYYKKICWQKILTV